MNTTEFMSHPAPSERIAAMDQQDLGRWGEQLASQYYQQRGYVVLAQNWQCRLGEIDLIVSKNNAVVFCEVKTRRSQRYGTAIEAVTKRKVQRLRRLAQVWLKTSSGVLIQDLEPQLDVIGITQLPGGAELVHIRNAQW